MSVEERVHAVLMKLLFASPVNLDQLNQLADLLESRQKIQSLYFSTYFIERSCQVLH